MSDVIVRVAPSPTGYLHVGNARAALLNYLFAHHAGGKFMLRIDDTDDTRSKPEFEAAIIEDLHWLGIEWDAKPLRQSERRAIYETYRQRLDADGLLYRCFKTRKEILEDIARAPHGAGEGPDGVVFTGAPLPVEELWRHGFVNHLEATPEVVLARANAIVNQVFVASVNAAGPAGVGRSLVVDPEGRVRVEAVGAEATVAVAGQVSGERGSAHEMSLSGEKSE